MAENVFKTFAIAGQGMSAQRMKLSAVANNIANVNTTKSLDGQPYKRQITLVRSVQGSPFEEQLQNQISMTQTSPGHAGTASQGSFPYDYRVLQAKSAVDSSPPRMVYDPSHPDANENGYVSYPNVNIVTEMVEMISAERAFEANTNAVEAAKNLAKDALDI